MTLDEARQNLGRAVIYRPHPGAEPETGFITGAGQMYVFVRYGSNGHSTATPPELVTLDPA